jgi:uncharacterized repeat protein (TIGR03837 family)
MAANIAPVPDKHTLSVDVFCRVVDNFGDAGVCWRLARRLGAGLGWHVRLFVDNLQTLTMLEPQINAHSSTQMLHGIEVLKWEEAQRSAPAQVVIEAFACDPPAPYVERMVQRGRASVWINLEYFSAEPWVSGCHTLPSPQSSGLVKYFFFPGFWDHTGGVIHSPAELEAMTHAASQPRKVLAEFDVHPDPEASVILLFSYPAACMDEMLEDAASTGRSLHFLIPAGPVADRLLGTQSIKRHQRITFQRLAFCPQARFDLLLAACDLNFVRGEDSLVRAVLAGKPFVWNIYAQEDYAHLNKLQAFIQWWESGAGPELQAIVRLAHGAWNNHHWPAGTFDQMMQLLPRWGVHAQGVAAQVWLEEDLGSQLAAFVRDKLNLHLSEAGAQELTVTAAL